MFGREVQAAFAVVPPVDVLVVDQAPSPELKFSLKTVVPTFVAAPVRFTVPPVHTDVLLGMAVTAVGADLTKTVTVDVPVIAQPVLVPVTVYVVVLVGLAVTTAPVVEFSPVAGDHV